MTTTTLAVSASFERVLARPPRDLTDSELRMLFDRWQTGGDRRALDRLTERFLPLARQLARRYANSRSSIDDLIGVANYGLVKAIGRFDASQGAAFSSFAVPTILGELRRSFRDTGWGVHVARSLQDNALKVERTATEIAYRTGRDPSPQQLAEYLEWPLEDVVEALEAAAGHFPSSLDAPVSDADGEIGTVISTIGAVDQGYEMVEARLTVTEAINDLPVHMRRVVQMRFAEDLTQQQIGDRLGVSQMQISRLLRQALAEVRARTDQVA